MALLNHAKNELSAKIVYYGPGLSGKTTNLEWIHKKLEPEKRGKLISLETKTDRTLFFDFLPVQIGEIMGYRLRFNVYTVPGQIFYNETRRMVLKGVDGVVFVADSQKEMANENLENLKNLAENLKAIGKSLSEVPLVFQYNKRDLPNVLSVQELNRLLNPRSLPFFEAVAIRGEGIVTTLTRITRMVADHLKQNLFERPEPHPRKPPTPGHVRTAGAQGSPALRVAEPRSEVRTDEVPAFLQDARQIPIAADQPEPVKPLPADFAPQEPAMFLHPEGEKTCSLSELASNGCTPPAEDSIPDLGDPAAPPLQTPMQKSFKVIRPSDKQTSLPTPEIPPERARTSWADPSQIDLSIQTPVEKPLPPASIQVGAPEREDQHAIRIPVRIRLPDSGQRITFQIVLRVEPRDPVS